MIQMAVGFQFHFEFRCMYAVYTETAKCCYRYVQVKIYSNSPKVYNPTLELLACESIHILVSL